MRRLEGQGGAGELRWTFRLLGGALLAAALLSAPALSHPLSAQPIDEADRPFNEQVLRPFGQPIIPVYEGWFALGDGSRHLCFGYMSPNTRESVEVPRGPQNFLEPAEYDGFQPTHFRPVPPRAYRRDYCVFTVEVPADFGIEDRITWTIQTVTEPLSVPGGVNPAYELDEPATGGRGDIAPFVGFAPDSPKVQGRVGRMYGPVRARPGEFTEFTAYVDHPEEEGMWVIWAKHDGPGGITFEPSQLQADEAGVARTMVMFDQPGDYTVRVQSTQNLGSFDFQCCWTNAYLQVEVR